MIFLLFTFVSRFLFMKSDLFVILLIQLNFQSFKKYLTKEQEDQVEMIEKVMLKASNNSKSEI